MEGLRCLSLQIRIDTSKAGNCGSRNLVTVTKHGLAFYGATGLGCHCLMKELTPAEVLFYLCGTSSPEVTRRCEELRKDPKSLVSLALEKLRKEHHKALQIDWRKLCGADNDVQID